VWRQNVEFGLSHYSLGVKGVFIGDHAAWNDAEDSLYLQATPTLEVRNALKDIEVEMRGMASSGLYINTLTDVASGKVNECLTPGGGVNLSGVKIKIVGDSPEVGLYLTDINSQKLIKIPSASIPVNDPSKITFIVPSYLPAGDYKLSITTCFTTGISMLKEPRTYVFDYVLIVS
jgi:hypothetical protein